MTDNDKQQIAEMTDEQLAIEARGWIHRSFSQRWANCNPDSKMSREDQLVWCLVNFHKEQRKEGDASEHGSCDPEAATSATSQPEQRRGVAEPRCPKCGNRLGLYAISPQDHDESNGRFHIECPSAECDYEQFVNTLADFAQFFTPAPTPVTEHPSAVMRRLDKLNVPETIPSTERDGLEERARQFDLNTTNHLGNRYEFAAAFAREVTRELQEKLQRRTIEANCGGISSGVKCTSPDEPGHEIFGCFYGDKDNAVCELHWFRAQIKQLTERAESAEARIAHLNNCLETEVQAHEAAAKELQEQVKQRQIREKYIMGQREVLAKYVKKMLHQRGRANKWQSRAEESRKQLESLRQQGRWIPCSERLPEVVTPDLPPNHRGVPRSEDVLACDQAGWLVAWYGGYDGRHHWIGVSRGVNGDVTCWQLAPSPPSAQDDKETK